MCWLGCNLCCVCFQQLRSQLHALDTSQLSGLADVAASHMTASFLRERRFDRFRGRCIRHRATGVERAAQSVGRPSTTTGGKQDFVSLAAGVCAVPCEHNGLGAVAASLAIIFEGCLFHGLINGVIGSWLSAGPEPPAAKKLQLHRLVSFSSVHALVGHAKRTNMVLDMPDQLVCGATLLPSGGATDRTIFADFRQRATQLGRRTLCGHRLLGGFLANVLLGLRVHAHNFAGRNEQRHHDFQPAFQSGRFPSGIRAAPLRRSGRLHFHGHRIG